MKGKIFNTNEVQAIIAGNKTMFREVLKPRIKVENYKLDDGSGIGMEILLEECPYQVGQEIFVKESWKVIQFEAYRGLEFPNICYESTSSTRLFINKIVWDYLEPNNTGLKWRSAKSMPQWASRLTLEITDVKVERLGEISEEDCKKEGIGYTGGWNGEDYDNGEFYFGKLEETKDGMNWENEMFEYPDLAFADLWNATHKKPEEKFEVNPFVWVVDFKINK